MYNGQTATQTDNSEWVSDWAGFNASTNTVQVIRETVLQVKDTTNSIRVLKEKTDNKLKYAFKRVLCVSQINLIVTEISTNKTDNDHVK